MSAETRRTEISCGCTQLFNLESVTDAWLRRNLMKTYRTWNVRDRPPAGTDLEIALRRACGTYDNKIYAGETVLFSDRKGQNGERLYKLIKHHKLGDIRKVTGRNPNTGNQITTYVWRYNGKQLPNGRA